MEKVTKTNAGVTKSMLGAQIQFAILEKAFQAITGFVKDSVGEFIRHENAVAQTEARLKSTGNVIGMTTGEMVKLSEAMQGVTTYEHDSVLEAENLLLTFTHIGKNIFPETTEAVMNMSTALGEDLKSSSIQLGKALQDPILGITALHRVGVAFTQDQKEMIKVLVESGQTEKAQKIILAELQIEFGGSARAARDTFGGSLKVLENDLGEVKEAVGAALVPALGGLVNMIMPLVEGLKTIDAGTIQMALGFVAALAGTYALGKGIEKLVTMFKTGITPLQGILIGIAAVGAICTVASDAINKYENRFINAAKAQEDERQSTHLLIGEYNNLITKTNLTSGEKVKLSQIESTLRLRINDVSSAIDIQTGKIIESSTAIQNYDKGSIKLQLEVLRLQQEKLASDQRLLASARNHEQTTIAESLRLTELMGFLINIDTEQEDYTIAIGINADAQNKNAVTIANLTAILNGEVPAIKKVKDAKDEDSDSTEVLTAKEKALAAALHEISVAGMNDQQKEVDALNQKKQEYLALGLTEVQLTEWYASEMAKINEKYANAAAQAWVDKITTAMQQIMEAVNLGVSSIMAVWNQALQNEETSLDNKYKREKAAIIANVHDKNEQAKQLAALDANYAAKKKALQEKQWIAQQATAITGAIMSTAQGVASALSMAWMFPFNLVLAGIVATLGAIQIGLIASQEMPEYAAGGPLAPGYGLVGERGPEIIASNGNGYVYTADETQDILSGNGGSLNVTQPLILQIDSAPIYRGLQRATKDGIALIDQGAIITQ
jgi:hypothetical protein